MKKIFAFLCLSALVAASTIAADYELSIESDRYADTNMDQLFQQYRGDAKRISTEIPYPNYNDDLVKQTVSKLNTVAPVSFYMYSAVISNYGFRKGTDESFPWEQYEDILTLPKNQQFGQAKDWDTGELKPFDVEFLKPKFDYEYYNKDSRPPKSIEIAGEITQVKGNTHAFLVYLCGEFRDRPTLIKEKLEWIEKMYKLPAEGQPTITAEQVKEEGKSIWSYVAAESYAYYVMFSRKAFAAKEANAWAESRTMPLSEKWNVDKPVPAFDVCEVKYMMTEYVFKKPTAEDVAASKDPREFPGYDAYLSGLENYRATYCTAADNDYYYDFRGDSNMKPNSPESNGMIWYATSIMGRCGRSSDGSVYVKKDRVTGEALDFAQEACEGYMSKPFANRWNAARAGLATWVMRNEKYDDHFANTRNLVQVVPTLNPESGPAGFKMYDGEVYSGSDGSNYMDKYAEGLPGTWLSADLGFNSVFGVSPNGVIEIDYAYERLKDAVDRHTDWYASGYDDSNFEPVRSRVIEQAYSPFVASSYEMSESDAFTAPGITVNGPVDGRRQWMFVFKVHKDKWYNTESLAAGKPVNFETQWFDETSFGTTHLADTERAWDRLGTPLEGEMESILYLHNIKNEGSAIKSMSNSSQYPAVVDDALGKTH